MSDISNLLEETTFALRWEGKTFQDVLWIGTSNYTIPVSEFVSAAHDLYYDGGYGSAVISQDLRVVGEDWYLERREYDGAEWWEYVEWPKQPSAKGSYLFDSDYAEEGRNLR